jgi:hypothetical protein
MNKIRVGLSLTLASLVLVSCATIGPGFTVPPINIPSFSIPSFSIPSFPPIVLPSGLPTSGDCPLLTAAEIGTIMGSAPISTESTDGCTFTFSNLSTVNVSIESGSDLNASKTVFGASARDLTVAGLPAVSGTLPFINQPALHVQRGADQLQVFGFLLPADDATIAKLVQIATIAVGRWS